ncbi:chemotaxis protein CheW [Almyronema epifaneia]|uniref:Chemotaxis protein CheW n=1 Tax=Almyronema epifaneia S1 TaxID=2991925 RepID=A0ABW6IB76_9CYAN
MNTSAIVPLPDRAQKATGEAHLKFHLGAKVPAVFAMAHVQEVLTLPVQRLTPLPNMPACMLGLMNHRSRVLWVVDLACLLEISRLDVAAQQYNLIVIRVGKLSLGLAVQQIDGMVWFERDIIQSPLGQTTTGLVPYLQGCIWQEDGVLLVLDTAAVSQASLLRHPDVLA